MEDISIKEDKSFDEVAEKNEATEKPNKSDKSNNSEAPKKESRGKNIAITILSIVVLALSATLAVLLINSKKDNQDNKQNETSKTEEKKEDSEKKEEQQDESEKDEAAGDNEEKTITDDTLKSALGRKVLNLNMYSAFSVDGVTMDSTFFSLPVINNVSRLDRLYKDNLTAEDKIGIVINANRSKTGCSESDQKYVSEALSVSENNTFTCNAIDAQGVAEDYYSLYGEEMEMMKKVAVNLATAVYNNETGKYYMMYFPGGGATDSYPYVLVDGYTTKEDMAFVYYRGATYGWSGQGHALYNDLALSVNPSSLTVVKQSERYIDPKEERETLISLISENRSSLARYRFVFQKNKNGEYSFKRVERV